MRVGNHENGWHDESKNSWFRYSVITSDVNLLLKPIIREKAFIFTLIFDIVYNALSDITDEIMYNDK